MPSRTKKFDELKPELVDLIKRFGYEKRDQPFQLSSGELSVDYIDGKKAISDGSRLRFVAEAAMTLIAEFGAEFDAVGGLTMGADPLAHAISLISGKHWFSVRKEKKKHGRQQMIEGAVLERGTRVVLIDDVVTTGASIVKALDAISDLEVSVLLAIALVDRGESAQRKLAAKGVPFEALVTYRDLDIEPVGAQRLTA